MGEPLGFNEQIAKNIEEKALTALDEKAIGFSPLIIYQLFFNVRVK